MQDIEKYVLRLADNALILSHRLSEWCSKGPTLEEDIAISKYPQLKNIKLFLEKTNNAEFVRMTGSGSTVVAFYRSVKDCNLAKVEFKRKFKNCWLNVSKTI